MEAAASLFGSEEPGSDPFASLGTESGSATSPANDLFLGDNDSSFITPDADTLNLPSQTVVPAAHDTSSPGYQTSPAGQEAAVPDAVPYGHQNISSGQNQWGRGGHERTLASSYAAPVYTTVTPPAPTYSHGYTPTMHAPPMSTYPQYNPYEPPPTIPAPHYSPATVVNGAPHQAHESRPPPASSSQYAAPAVSAPPVPTLTTSTITRPKVSNAYDPPFLPSKPNRRTGRATSAHQTYSAYQSPPPMSSYVPPPELSSTYSGPFYQLSPPSIHGHDLTPASSGNYHAPSNPYSPPNAYKATNSYAPTQTYAPSSSYAPTSTTSPYVHDGYTASTAPQANYSPSRGEIAPPHPPLDHSILVSDSLAGNTQREDGLTSPVSDPYAMGTSSPARSSSIGSTSSLTRESSEHMPGEASAAEPAVLSPSMVPLPYSPPLQTEELQPYSAGSMSRIDTSSQPTPQQTSYLPLRKDSIMHKDTHDPYVPKINHPSDNYIPRTSSPLSVYSRPNEQKKPSRYAPPSLNSNVPRPLAPSTLPVLKTLSNSSVDDLSDRYASYKSDAKLAAPQELIVKSTIMQYAPSPSLIGANDPLSRTSARAPVVTFGFGGKMVTCFHGMPGLNAGFDVALSARTSSELKIHRLNKILPESAMCSPGQSYPGPLLSDPGTPSLSLVRPGASAQAKTKKTGVIAYLASRAGEIHQGLGYLGPAEKQAAENKLILINLLKVLVENDGRLLGTMQAESAVRSALVPRLEGLARQDGAALQAAYKSTPFDEAPLSVVSVRSSTLDRIEELLLQGDRRQAYQFAMDEKLWAHAMVIASSIDKEAWKEVVNEFLRGELNAKEDTSRSLVPNSPHTTKSGRQSLRVAYSLFSGQGAAAVQELAPVTLLQRATGLLQPPIPSGPAITPRTPNFAVIQPHPTVPPEALDKWAETVAMMISSPLTSETSSALTALGDQLLANSWVDAAHACYLLSPQTSLIGGFGTPAARLTLVGARNSADAVKNPDTLVFSEIWEFALSLVPTAKGQEPFHGLPHLQVYRFIQAVSFAETGDILLANRYCEAITTSLTHTPPYATQALLEQLHGLQQRLSGVFNGDRNASWISGKISKPSLDSIGGWLEGRFTKLVTGDSDSADSPSGQTKVSDQTFNGPFAHYSTISSTTPSARSSPQPPPATINHFPPPQRTTSAMATSSPYSHVPVERSSSAMGYLRQKPPVPMSTSTSSVSSSESSPTGYGLNGYARDTDPYAPTPHAGDAEELETPVRGANWWGSDDAGQTPTAATFMKIEESSIQASSDGFISLMDTQTFSFSSHPPRQPSSSSRQEVDDEEDNLGLGNSKPKPQKEEEPNAEESPMKEKAADPAKAPAAAPAAPESNGGGSWFGRWWKRSDSNTPGPVKASLGEKSTFYYDKELKRWVNKTTAAEANATPAVPPPPPSRAQTASPGMTHARSTPPPPSGPPMRPASAIDLTTEPPTKVPMRIRSSLAPPTESAPSTPTGTRLNPPSGPPPPGRPKSQATKRPVRNRYVDVFQQEAGAS